MTGTNHERLVLQPRDQRLLGELAVMRVIDREQAKPVAGFGSTTRANRRLLALTRAGLLRRFFQGTILGGRKAIYCLSPRGASLIGAPLESVPGRPGKTLIANPLLEHRTRINTVYVAVKHRVIPIQGVRFRRWISFSEPLSTNAAIIPDGYFELESPEGVLAMFLEIDLGTEALRRWEMKAQAYLRFAVNGEFPKTFEHHRFRVLVLAHSQRRLREIRRVVARLTDKIFWFSAFDSAGALDFWSLRWLRPRGEERRPLV